MSRQILVTGGAGFIGSHLIDRLINNGEKVICIDDLSLGKIENISHLNNNPDFNFIKQDLLDIEALKKVFKNNSIELVFHLAANSDIKEGARNRKIDLEKNFLTTFNVLECMKEFNVKKIVFSSTSAIYGETDSLINESYGPLFPISFYGASKLAAEAYISVYSDNFDIQTWIFRFPNVVGGRATHGIIYDLFNKLKKNPDSLEVLGDGNQEKPYLHVSELIDAILFCIKNSNNRLNCFNIASDSETNVKTIAEKVIETFGKNSKIVYTGGNRGWKGDVPKFKYDTSKIKKLGWTPKLTSDESISRAVTEIFKEIFN